MSAVSLFSRALKQIMLVRLVLKKTHGTKLPVA